MSQTDLMTLPPQRFSVPKRGYAARPGGGPVGQTCGSCQHVRVNTTRADRNFRKCGLTEPKWTRGPGSDIRKGDPACILWAAPAVAS